MQKEGNGIARLGPALPGGVDNAMGGGFETVIAESL
jgi:hypothetical protein